MAIKFTEKDPSDETPKQAEIAMQARSQAIEPEPAPAAAPTTNSPDGEGYLPGLAH